MTKIHLLRTLAGSVILLAVLGGLLALDLANHGLAWQFFWSQTGEEEPLAQVRGMVEWAGNLTRQQPKPDPLVPINHRGDIPYGVNTFLNQEVEAAKVEAQLRMISEARIRWIRQEFPWQDIEVDGRGQFTDSRNAAAIGVVDAWSKYDRIVDLAEKYDIKIQARLSAPPAWSRAEVDLLGLGPPDNFQDFVNFAVAAAERYQGRVQHFQIWNEPNIFPEWGSTPDGAHKPVNPEAYTELLCRTYDALKQVDPEIVVISAAMAPTNELNERNLNDFIYWQRMYDAGAGACFDVLSMQGYGLNSGPTDRRMRPVTVTFARNLYIRDLMVANGDAHKPIWISEVAWNYSPTEAEHPEPIAAREAYGQVTPDQAARYITLGYQRALEEWPWVGVMNYWYFTLPDQSRKAESFYYFRMVDTDYNAETGRFTPMPVYTAMKDYITTQTPTLYQGVHQADGHWAISADNAQVINTDNAQFGKALETDNTNFMVRGTDLVIRWKSEGEPITVEIGGEARTLAAEAGTWHTSRIFSAWTPETQQIRLWSNTPFLLDSVTVADRTFEHVYPVVGVSVVIFLLLMCLLVLELKSRPT